MNKIIIEYIDNDKSRDIAFNESIRYEKDVPEDTHCAVIARAFNSFLLAFGYSPETIKKYINQENLYDDIDD